MKDRLTFLYLLFNASKIDNIADVRIANSQFDTSRILGETAKERKNHLTIVYQKYVNILPLETPSKKKPNFTMRKA